MEWSTEDIGCESGTWTISREALCALKPEFKFSIKSIMQQKCIMQTKNCNINKNCPSDNCTLY